MKVTLEQFTSIRKDYVCIRKGLFHSIICLLVVLILFTPLVYVWHLNHQPRPAFSCPEITEDETLMISVAQSSIGKYPISRRGYGCVWEIAVPGSKIKDLGRWWMNLKRKMFGKKGNKE